MPKLPRSKDLFVMTLKVHQAVYEGTRGLIGHRILLGMPALMLRTTGRRSGLTRTNALVYGKDDDRLMVVASNGGHHKPPAWLLNLEANPEVEVQVGLRRWPATATALRPDDPDYDRLFAIANLANRGQFAAYQKMTDRPLPVVVLTRREAVSAPAGPATTAPPAS
jgi:deazaflavin-dependent oxidoreductase (nitroreductase family)